MTDERDTAHGALWPYAVNVIIWNYYSTPTLVATEDAFYALCVDGIVYERRMHEGGEPVVLRHSNIHSITPNRGACLAITSSGHICTWGEPFNGGGAVPREDARIYIDDTRARGARPMSVYHTPHTFIVPFSDRSKLFLGATSRWEPNLNDLDLTAVDSLFANYTSFAALMKDKTVQTWESLLATTYDEPMTYVTKEELTDVKSIHSTLYAFAALRTGGTVVTWGQNDVGGDSKQVKDELYGIQNICATNSAFAALRVDGSVVHWGYEHDDGESSVVLGNMTQVTKICATGGVFAALTAGGTVVTWGSANAGKIYTKVQAYLKGRIITDIHAGGRSFTAIAKHDKRAITWGYNATKRERFLHVTKTGNHDIRHVVSVRDTFLATTASGDVFGWGGDSKMDADYTQILNKHRSSIRKRFEMATGFLPVDSDQAYLLK